MTKTADTDLLAWKNFVRYRRIATGLLVGMGSMTFLGYMLPYYGILKNGFWLELFRAGCQAGFIGACADWFAVTALFRHPLGLPIPHTAILPKQQKRLGYGVGYFIAHYVFTKEALVQLIEKLDFPSLVGRYIAEPDHLTGISDMILKAVPDFLNHWEKGKIRNIVNYVLNRLINGDDITPLMGRALRVLVDNAQYQEVVSFILGVVQKLLKEKEETLRDMIHHRVKEQGGRLVGWMIGDSIATKVLVAVNRELERMDPNDVEIRERIGEWIKKEITRIADDPERMQKMAGYVKQLFSHEMVQDWKEQAWQNMRTYIEEDIQKDQGVLKTLIQDSLLYFSDQLNGNASIRHKLCQTLETSFVKSFPFMQERILHFTESVISEWDSQALTNRLECRIGKDLQYIRINGSIVGFLIGMVLYLLMHFYFGSEINVFS